MKTVDTGGADMSGRDAGGEGLLPPEAEVAVDHTCMGGRRAVLLGSGAGGQDQGARSHRPL